MGLDVETNRIMTNWARWKSGASIRVAVSAAYQLEARGRREEVSEPLMNGEANDVDDAVSQLEPELQVVIVQFWLKPGSIRQKARASQCVVDTFYRRLDHAHARVRTHLQHRRDAAEHRRDALSSPSLVKLG